mmetsp:Transcript_41804/g.97898  ORF Transcript_41804/g.97898 Transcript_41804/m.97898 type:complete len:131 (+) Transcript_41804:231-623(+)
MLNARPGEYLSHSYFMIDAKHFSEDHIFINRQHHSECREQICIGNTGRNRMPNPKKLGAKCQTDDDCKSNRCSPNTKTCMCQICRGSGCGDCGKHFQCFEPWYKGLDNRCDRAPKWYGEYCSKNIDCISQ